MAGFARSGGGFLGRGEEGRVREAGDGIFVLGFQLVDFFGVVACGFLNQCAVAFGSDAGESAVDLFVDLVLEGARGGGWDFCHCAARWRAFSCCDEELAVYRLWGSRLLADAEFLFEPFERLRAAERPDDVDLFGHGFGVAHLFDEVEEVGYYGRDAGSACEENDGVEGGEVPAHTTVWTIDEGAVGLFGGIIQPTIEDFACKAPERAEDKGHVFVIVAIAGREVGRPERGDGEGVILEDGDAWHTEVDVLAGSPFLFCWDGDFDGVLLEHSDGCFFTNEP